MGAIEEYHKALDDLVKSIRLVVFWTREAAEAAEKASAQTLITVRNIREYINKRKI